MGITHNLFPSPENKSLTGCIIHLGSLSDISKLIKAFNKNNKKFFMSFNAFAKFCRRSKLESSIDQVFQSFSKGSPKKISIYELISGITLFSSLNWQEKVKLGFSLFDFDNDLKLNKDELKMLTSMYSNSIHAITSVQISPPDLFSMLNKNSEDEISLSE
jgi:Ca2+-binding EF-hand superfamily protein